MGNDSKLEVLMKAVANTAEQANIIKNRYTAKKKELDNIETDLILARVEEDRAREALDRYKLEYVIEDSLDVERRKEIAEFTERMPAAMAAIERTATIIPITDTSNRMKRRKERNMARRVKQRRTRKLLTGD